MIQERQRERERERERETAQDARRQEDDGRWGGVRLLAEGRLHARPDICPPSGHLPQVKL